MINSLRRIAYVGLMIPFGIAWSILVLVLGLLSTIGAVIVWIFTGRNITSMVDSIMDPTVGGLERAYRKVKP
jgi:hypothetical protein